jgi:hypothetical protein
MKELHTHKGNYQTMPSRWFPYVSLSVLYFSGAIFLAVAQDKSPSKRLTTDQLLERLRSIKNLSLQAVASETSNQDMKCGFGIHAQVVNRLKEFSLSQRAELSALMKADVMQCDTIVGHFHIFYDTTGINEPALLNNNNQRIPGTAKAYIDSVARILNHVWDVEIDQMGYAAPPFESGQSFYNIYVEDLVSDYGDTVPIDPQINGTDTPPRYRSYITIDNDFQESNYYSHGMNGLKVTAAHEFNHAIQIGSYGYWIDDTYAYELTATWFEDVVYTDVNDYYNYLSDYFVGFSSGLSFNSSYYGGYERCIWAHFLAKRFSQNLMRSIWTAMRSQPFLESVDSVLQLPVWGSGLQSAFAEFSKWNYFTWDRADTLHYYPEGNHYPRFKPLQKLAFYNTTSTSSGNVQPLSSSMYEFDMQQDTITALIANVDAANAIGRNVTQQTVNVTLSSQSLSSPSQNLANGLKAKISVDTLSLWRWYFMQDSTGIITRLQSNAAPNPFRLAVAQKLYLPINEDNAQWASVYIYDSALKLAYAGQLQTSYNENGGTRVIEVPASEIKSKLSSGIYFILAKTANSDYKWKVAVIR